MYNTACWVWMAFTAPKKYYTLRLTRSTFPKEPFPIAFIMSKLSTVIFLVAGLLALVSEVDAEHAGFLRMRLMSSKPLGTAFAPCSKNLAKSMLSKISWLEYSNVVMIAHNHSPSLAHLQSSKQYYQGDCANSQQKIFGSKSVGTWIRYIRFVEAKAES